MGLHCLGADLRVRRHFSGAHGAVFPRPGKGGGVRWIVPYLVIGAALGMPTWAGDGNPLYYFPFLLAAFLIGYGGRLAARLVVGMIFFEWIIAWSMIVDTRAVLPGSAGYWGAMAWKLAMWAAVWLLMRRVFRDSKQVALSGRLWALLGLLALSPLLSELAFSMWDIRAYTLDGTDALIDAAFYTLLPFVFVSAIALLFAVVLLSRHQALEQEHQIADMRELYYQGIRREQEQVRRLRHDMRNHLTALSGLLERGRMTARWNMCAACSGVSPPAPDAASSGAGRFTENDTVNIVLSAKARDMEQARLIADINVSLPENLPIADPDLCALFGNAVDNAIGRRRMLRTSACDSSPCGQGFAHAARHKRLCRQAGRKKDRRVVRHDQGGQTRARLRPAACANCRAKWRHARDHGKGRRV